MQIHANHLDRSGSSQIAVSGQNSTKNALDETKKVFQKFVAGSFYKQMFKAMRKMHDKPAYFHGGQAEEMFQSQIDQQISENLAEQQGASIADPLFESFTAKVRAQSISRNSQSAGQAGRSSMQGTIAKAFELSEKIGNSADVKRLATAHVGNK
ncbi:MAG: hypothetical protein Tsb009_25990 [Planctomycetaceae bacterium]